MTKHATDAVSLAFGLAFLAFVAWWQLARLVTIERPGFGWFLSAGLILLGAAGVFATLRADRHRPSHAEPPDGSTQL
jgi:hypothetical protein